jgi:peptide/nickel transport system substrate-binding protein
MHIHGKLENRALFGKNPMGTGPFRAVQIDTNKGIILERSPTYTHGGQTKPTPRLNRYFLKPVPEMATRVAELLSGSLDMILPVELHQAEDLSKDPRFRMSVYQGINYTYMAIDSSGRSGAKALADQRIRRALFMSIDRKELIRVATGDPNFPRVPASMCWEEQEACGVKVAYPAYDPAGAKKLLAEAGYANGFPMVINTNPNLQNKIIAEVVSGFFDKIGVKASVVTLTNIARRDKLRNNEVQMYIGPWTGGGMADAAGTMQFLFTSGDASAYQDDQALRSLASQSMETLDPVKRRELGGAAYDLATEKAYFYALVPLPTIALYNADIVVSREDRYNAFGFEPNDVWWK